LESLADGLSGEWSNSPTVLTNERKTGCFPDMPAFKAVATSFAGPKAFDSIAPWVDTKSNYFQLTTRVTLGTTEFTLYSLLFRGGTGTGTGKVTPLLRSFGTP
jgi:hypothetical protein